jgi:Na+-driven multidrug efflux pump
VSRVGTNEAASSAACLTFLLLAAEGLLVNGLFSHADDPRSIAARLLPGSLEPTSAVAAWFLFDNAARFLSMPVIAVGVALLPLSARLWGRGDVRGIAAEVRTALFASLVYAAALAPLALLLAPVVARALIDSPECVGFATTGLRWVPFAVLLAAPSFLLRSTFDGMQRPRPGLVASAVRTVLLALPLLLLGMHVAAALGLAPITGAFAGFSAGAGGASLLLFAWLRRSLREEDRPRPA